MHARLYTDSESGAPSQASLHGIFSDHIPLSRPCARAYMREFPLISSAPSGIVDVTGLEVSSKATLVMHERSGAPTHYQNVLGQCNINFPA